MSQFESIHRHHHHHYYCLMLSLIFFFLSIFLSFYFLLISIFRIYLVSSFFFLKNFTFSLIYLTGFDLGQCTKHKICPYVKRVEYDDDDDGCCCIRLFTFNFVLWNLWWWWWCEASHWFNRWLLSTIDHSVVKYLSFY